MSARTSGWGRPPIFTTTRLTLALIVAVVVLPLLPLALAGAGAGWGLLGYLAFAALTAWTLRGVRREAGTWLGRRAVRRGLVVALLADCAALVALTAPGAFPVLLALLVLLNVALGRATLHVASAPDQAVDERQEALRNRSHRVAYWAFALLVGGTIAVAEVAGPASRSWVASALTTGGAGVAFLELVFVLPGMAVAWLEPDHVAPEADVLPDRRARLGLSMLALAIAWPAVLSLGVVVLPVRTSRTVTPVVAGSSERCVELMATSQVGLVVEAQIPVHAVACGDGRTARPGYGLNQSDCHPAAATLATVTTDRCSRGVGPDGTLRFTYGATVRPVLLPILNREVAMQVVVDRDGHVVRFP